MTQHSGPRHPPHVQGTVEPRWVTAQRLNGDAPAHYRICAQGLFEARWLDLLSGDWVIDTHRVTSHWITFFVGCVADQAALMGVLEQLYSLGFPLLLVEHLAEEDGLVE